jgi:hypothetical protein
MRRAQCASRKKGETVDRSRVTGRKAREPSPALRGPTEMGRSRYRMPVEHAPFISSTAAGKVQYAWNPWDMSQLHGIMDRGTVQHVPRHSPPSQTAEPPQHPPIARWRSARPEPAIERPCGILIGGNTAPKGSVLSALPSLLYLEVEVQ